MEGENEFLHGINLTMCPLPCSPEQRLETLKPHRGLSAARLLTQWQVWKGKAGAWCLLTPLLHPLYCRNVLENRSSCSTVLSSSRWRRDPLMPSRERLATPSVKTSLFGSRLTTKCWLVQAKASLVLVLARTARSSSLETPRVLCRERFVSCSSHHHSCGAHISYCQKRAFARQGLLAMELRKPNMD